MPEVKEKQQWYQYIIKLSLKQVTITLYSAILLKNKNRSSLLKNSFKKYEPWPTKLAFNASYI